MRPIKRKTSQARTRMALQKRGSPPWWIGVTVRHFWGNLFFKKTLIVGLFFLFCAPLWWTEYPHRLSNSITYSIVATTGRLGFCLSDVLVEGRKNAPLDKILRVVNAQQGAPLLAYDPYRIKKQLEEISWIRHATVKRQLPGMIYIQLSERTPVALWQYRQQHYLVDEQGVIISSDTLQAFDKLPIIIGEDAPVYAPHILHTLEKFPDIRKKLTALVRVGGRRWDLHLDQTLQIKLPETKVEEALARLTLFIKQKGVNSTAVSLIDLRKPNQMVVRLSPSAAIRLKGKGKET